MPRGSLEALVADPDFPALGLAAQPGYLLDCLRRAGLVDAAQAAITEIEVLNLKPGRRCTVRYAVESLGEHFDVVGKWYRDPDQAASMYRLQQALAAQGVFLPRPLLLTPEGAVLQDFVHGPPLRDLLAEDDLRPFVEAGLWLARLHSLTPPAGLREKTLDHELAKIEGWAGAIVSSVPEWDGLASETARRLRRSTVYLEVAKARLIHRDYYSANLLWDGNQLWGIDFDQMALGDPALDVGTFLAQLEKLALRDELARRLFESKALAFRGAYEEAGGDKFGSRLPFFTAYTFLKLAAAEVQRQRPRWRELAAAFLTRASKESAALSC